jgi:hypothetical protein
MDKLCFFRIFFFYNNFIQLIYFKLLQWPMRITPPNLIIIIQNARL